MVQKAAGRGTAKPARMDASRAPLPRLNQSLWAAGIDMETLMRMQNSYNIAQTRSRASKIRVERYEPQPTA